MLHWLAGAKAPDGSTDPDATVVDAPETPAPVFAVRAFKHAIFGTPTPQTQAKPRRHSSTERERQRPTLAKPARPPIVRPKSAGDAQTLVKQGDVPEPMPSPTKGILMTPGTAAARRKTVTFGDHVVDNENKKVPEGSKTGLPNDCPGKFPSPWVQPSEKLEKDDGTPNDRKRGRSKLTEELHKARDESAKRKVETTDHGRGDKETIADFIEPNSEAGKYWKREYDIYRANTTREVKRLVQKQRSAKSFAAEKDSQCTELADQLRQEKKRADRLERRAAELEAQVKALQSQLENDRKPLPSHANVDAKPLSGAAPFPKPRDAPPPVPEKFAPASAMYAESTQQATTMQARTTKQEEPEAIQGFESKPTRPARTRHRSGNLPTDIWAQNFASSNTKPANEQDAPVAAVRNGRTVTSGTNATPLKSLSINTRSSVRPSSRDGPQPVNGNVRPVTARVAPEASLSTTAEPKEQKRNDFDDVVFDSPHASPEETPKRPRLTSKHSSNSAAQQNDLPSPSIGQLPSSPFIEDALEHPSTPTPTPKASAARPAAHRRTESKENHSPVRKAMAAAPVPEDKDALQVPRQSAVPAGGAMRSKDGREVSADRLEAARARLAARGVRHVS